MLFSDNVPVEQEIVLKDEAARHDVLVMGPDCGTAVVGGLGLGFANALRPGPVGIVAASGTGAQEVTCLLDADDVGVTAVLGVGGRDLSAAVGGRSTLAAMKVLDEHPGTEFVVVLSKPPDPRVADKVRAAAAQLKTPVFRSHSSVVGRRISPPPRHESFAPSAACRRRRRSGQPPMTGSPRSGFVRGLFSGGTLCDEAMAIAADSLGPIASNTPLEPTWALGSDLCCAGPSHDRLRRRPADDRKTAPDDRPVSAPRTDRPGGSRSGLRGAALRRRPRLWSPSRTRPTSSLRPSSPPARRPDAAGRDLAVVVSLVGSRSDPQGRDSTAKSLAAAGASVHLSNAAAAREAVRLVEGADR